MGLEFPEGSLFLIGLEHIFVEAKEIEKGKERERKHSCASRAH